MSVEKPAAFGLIVIGDEVLKGSRQDQHFEAFKSMLAKRGLELSWHWLLPDDPEVLVSHLRFSYAHPDPVFVCGGIGATPDDHTRACAALAGGVELVRHRDAVAILEEKFGDEAYPHRIGMAELPSGSTLIPNPVNRIPGFSFHDHWFLPGFPKMAWPMAEWVLEEHFGGGAPLREAALKVPGVLESEIIPIMESLGERFPALKMFSLPDMGENPHILLGFRGRGDLDAALQALRDSLTERGMSYLEVPASLHE